MDRAKVEVVKKLPLSVSVKGVRSFFGYAGFYRRFIKDFSKIAQPLNALLPKEYEFVFDETYLQAFEKLKAALTPPIVQAPD